VSGAGGGEKRDAADAHGDQASRRYELELADGRVILPVSLER
jgi:hypothetical protein